jgi:hypothetical protein
MAITGVHFQLLAEHAPLFKRGGALLEIGEANWYGDLNPASVFSVEELAGIDPQTAEGQFALAKLTYRKLFAPAATYAVDLNGTERAFRDDLNEPLELAGGFDLVINHGTAEHVFNVCQVFWSMHRMCTAGGYMIHDAPFTGWLDHGFYNFQPTLFYDLAEANGYDLVSLSVTWMYPPQILRVASREAMHKLAAGEIAGNTMLFVVLRKLHDAPFRLPMQGVYDGRLSAAGEKAWRERR